MLWENYSCYLKISRRPPPPRWENASGKGFAHPTPLHACCQTGCLSIKHRENHRAFQHHQAVQDQINSSRHPLPAPKSLIGRFPLQGTPLSIMTQGWQSPTTSHAISFTALVMSQSVATLNLNSLRLPIPLPLRRDEIRMRDGPRNTADNNVINNRPLGEKSNQFSTEHDHLHVFITECYVIL